MTEPHPDLLSAISKVEDVDRAPPAGVPPSDDSVEASSDLALEGVDPVAEPPSAKVEPVASTVEATPVVAPVGASSVEAMPGGAGTEPAEPPAASVAPVLQAGPAAASQKPARLDTADLVTRDDLAAMKRELAAQISALDSHLGERIQVQGWALLAGVALLLAVAAAVIELF